MLTIIVLIMVSLAIINDEVVSTITIAVFLFVLAMRFFKGEEKPTETEQDDWYDIDWCN